MNKELEQRIEKIEQALEDIYNVCEGLFQVCQEQHETLATHMELIKHLVNK